MQQDVLEDSSESSSKLYSMNLGSSLALAEPAKAMTIALRLAKNQLSAQQDSALAPLNSA